MEDEQQQIRDELSRDYIEIRKGRSFMFDNIDSFVALSRENTTVTGVEFSPFDSAPGNYDFWDKVGQIVGNLTELQTLHIDFLPYYFDDDDDDDGDEARMHAWEMLTRILPHLRRTVTLCSSTEDYDANVDEIQGLARAINGHPMISEFSSHMPFSYANLGPWCIALATLPSLERITFDLQEPQTEDQRDLVNFQPLTELLRAPALRVVAFDDFYITSELCHAMANALEEGSSITDISLGYGCSFLGGGRATIVNALKTNATVTYVQFFGDCDEQFCNNLAVVLLCNSTLRNLALRLPEEGPGGRWLSSIFLSLGMNTTLESLFVSIYDDFCDELCAAIRHGLAKNSTLEELSLYNMRPGSDDGAVSARNALSFLRTNSTLKSLTVSFAQTQKASYVSAFRLAFRLEAVKMSEESPSLESLTIIQSEGDGIQAKELLALISTLQLNTTLKTLRFQAFCFEHICFTDDEVNQLVSILMRNYGLEHLVPDIPCADDGTVKAILRLNRAGRRYLIKDGSSISKGVDVLSAVSDEIDCVFLHLLENPSLCDRKAADTTTGSRRPASNLDESSGTGKRERALSQPGKEPRRRLA
jgi:hypothetical protein